MPFNAALLIAVIGVVLAIAVWARTRRLGPPVGIMIGAFIIMAITDPSIISDGGKKAGEAVRWFMDDVLNF